MATTMTFQGTERTGTARRDTRKRALGAALWTVQGALALVFLFAGVAKLMMPVEELTAQVALPGLFVQFIAVAEVAGALGLILPGLLRIRPVLTPLAASGLAIIMTGATVITLAIGGGAAAAMPLVIGILAAGVAYGRWQLAPQASR